MMRGKVRWDGKGEDPAVAAYLQGLVSADPEEAAELALAMDRLLKGDASILNDPDQVETLNKLRARAAKMKDAERRYEENKDKFIQGLWEKHEKYTPRGEKLEEVRAQGAQMVQNAIVYARANASIKKQKFKEIIKNGPKRTVFVSGNPVMTDKGMILEPIYINIMGVGMVLPPGQHTIPEPFARRYDDMKRAEAENRARSAALEEQMRADKLAQKWNEIDTEFGSVTNQDDAAALNIPGVY